MRDKLSKLALAATFGLALTLTFSCSGDGNSGSGGGGNDVGGLCDSDKGNNMENYKKVNMPDGKTWMAENLNYNVAGSKCYGEGSSNVVVGFDWDNFKPIYGTLSNAEIKANGAKYGRLYDWETAQTVCPSGWHLPSSDEMTTLVESVGGEDIAITKLKATSGWSITVEGKTTYYNGTDDYGFAALPSGSGSTGYWWSSSEDGSSYAYYRTMGYGDEDVSRSYKSKKELLSVRCVKD